MEYLVWKKGEDPLKSLKTKNNDNSSIKLALQEPNKELRFFSQVNEDKNIKTSSERERLNYKLNDRYLISQIAHNPFLKENKYIEDLSIQEKFLRPKCSYLEEQQEIAN